MIINWLRPYRVVILVFILIAFFLRIPILKVRYFDPDEFQHLHGARQIYYGEIPYRDYFDHHTPFIHFTLSLIYPIFGEEIRVLFVARSLMMVYTAAILYLTYLMARNLYGTDAGLLSVLFLSYVLIFLEKTIEVRPDLPAVMFWLASIISFTKGIQKRSWRWHVLSGVMAGTAIMCTQKVLFGLGGVLLALIYPFIDRRVGISWKRSLKLIVAFLGGISIPIAFTCFFFLAHDALWQFINCNFIMNSQWKVRFSPKGYISQMRNQNPFFLVMGIVGLILVTARIHKRSEVVNGSFVPVFCAYSLIIGLFIMPVPYRQYYQLFLPLMAMYCALILRQAMEFDFRRFVSSIRNRQLRLMHIISVILVFILLTAGVIYTLKMSKPTLSNLNKLLDKVSLGSKRLYPILWIPLIISAIVTFIWKKPAYAVMFISVGIIMYPLDQMINQFSQKNDGQLANIRYIMSVTLPRDAVLDGWSGYGFLRPHAYYYYFLHGEMRAMLSEKELSDDLIKGAEEKHTKIVIYDGDIQALPQKTQDYISANYTHTGQDNIYILKIP